VRAIGQRKISFLSGTLPAHVAQIADSAEEQGPAQGEGAAGAPAIGRRVPLFFNVPFAICTFFHYLEHLVSPGDAVLALHRRAVRRAGRRRQRRAQRGDDFREGRYFYDVSGLPAPNVALMQEG
jgi:hypothetical protein